MYKTLPSIFLCHAKEDRESVRCLYEKLKLEGFNPWFDEEDILPGQDWDYVIQRVLKKIDFILICLSRKSVSKRGYVNKEIKWALDRFNEMLINDIFLIPVKLEECNLPEHLSKIQALNLYERNGFYKLLKSLYFQLNKEVKFYNKDQSVIKPTLKKQQNKITQISSKKKKTTTITVKNVKANDVKIAKIISNTTKLKKNNDVEELAIDAEEINAKGNVEIAEEIIKNNE